MGHSNRAMEMPRCFFERKLEGCDLCECGGKQESLHGFLITAA